jgi:acyl-CoA hydrolase
MVTVSSSRVDFNMPIPAGTIIELIGQIEHVGRTSLKVSIQIVIEEMYADRRHEAIKGEFAFVAVDENRRPIPIIDPD